MESDKNGTLDTMIHRLKAGDRRTLARAITLVESSRSEDRRLAKDLVNCILPYSGEAVRLGITGVPGVGKSTFIEALGLMLIDMGHRVAVLAVDPSSRKSRGSVLGDKTRMQHLATRNEAFVRPSPSGGTLGGVASKTRESMLLCEAAGYDVVLVETVGVGQSETEVASMVDFFLVLMLAGAGDDLQGIKKGILEHADCVAVNKADGDNLKRAERAKADYERALHYLMPVDSGWEPVVTTCSALEGNGIDTIWKTVKTHRDQLTASGLLNVKREQQVLDWFQRMIEEEIRNRFYENPDVKKRLPELTGKVKGGQLFPGVALDRLFTE